MSADDIIAGTARAWPEFRILRSEEETTYEIKTREMSPWIKVDRETYFAAIETQKLDALIEQAELLATIAGLNEPQEAP